LEYKINLDLNNALSRMQKIVSQEVKPQINNVLKMITAKSKGSLTNLTQIMFSLGNQNVDGKRCPQGFRKRALPHFSKDDNSP
jgi:DNA-directed RNA polymerase II subunit RPB1